MRAFLILLVVLACASCGKSNHDKFVAANRKLMEVYMGTNATAAEVALRNYRDEVISSKGFAALVDTAYELSLLEARLASVNMHLGRQDLATFWFDSSRSNLNLYRQRNNRPIHPSSSNSLEEVIRKLDGHVDVGWRHSAKQR